MTVQRETTQLNKRPAAIRVVLPFVFRHWLKQPALAAATAGGFIGATIADLFMPVFSGRLVDAMTLGAADPAARHAAVVAFAAIVLLGLASMTALPPQDQRSLLHQVLAHETEPVVLQFAKNLNEVFEQSTTQPAATQPATQPTTAPVAQIATTAPTSAPALAADKATVVIPVLPLTTVPSIAPSTAPTTNSTK